MLYARFLPEHLEKALDIMSDMVLRPTLADLEREREVIVEEIRMYEDRPDQLADEHLSGLIFHDDPLGRPIIGSAETVRGVDHETLRTFHAGPTPLPTSSSWRPAGSSVTGADGGGEVLWPPGGRAFRRGGAPPAPGEPLLLQAQGDGAVPRLPGIQGIPAKSEDRYAMAALNNVLGGGMSSRLFQEVRERSAGSPTPSPTIRATRTPAR